MKTIIYLLLPVLAALAFFNGCSSQPVDMAVGAKLPNNSDTTVKKIVKTDAEWQKELTPDQFYVLRQKGTEYPGTGVYDKHFEKGLYGCAACKSPLFYSDAKFNSGCGWPAFFEPVNENAILYKTDSTHGMVRTEVMCNICGGHLGHVFEDGPPPTGLRYCINSISLNFTDDKAIKKEDE